MNKVFAFDLDGTLLRSDNTIHPYTYEVLSKLKQKGHRLIVATGRGLQKVLPLLKDKTLDLFEYIVCSNGGLAYDVQNQKILYQNTVSADILPIMLEIHEKYDSILAVDTESFNGTVLPNNKIPEWINTKNLMDLNILNLYTKQELIDITYKNKNSITQIALRNNNDIAQEITNEVKEKVKDFNCEVYLTNGVYTDVNPLNSSKFNGLKYILELLQKTEKDLIAFGDSGNDIDMLVNASCGYAMGNATEDAKKQANHVIKDHNTDTIGKTLEQFI
ncbi:HAD family hydrolase [Mycoplasma leonicaptivi]|uniref:HAD family hydrolase n=1 Tax=Mycoplasma leonicaptivi TaxID=36742 RepID=UPI00047F02E8|nr:HAD family hydrolase [Mycoplasma leonicaptivi]